MDVFEIQFGTNYLGDFALITRVDPLLADGGRLVVLCCHPMRIALPTSTWMIPISNNRHTTRLSPMVDRRQPLLSSQWNSTGIIVIAASGLSR